MVGAGVQLAEESGDCIEAGWVALARASHCTEPADRSRLVEEATRTAARFADADLHFDTLAYLGLALVEEGQISAGMRHLDEAAAAAQGGEVSSEVVAGEIYCKLLIACETTLDVRRAEEWQQVTGPLAGRPSLAWASAIYRMHYGGILVAPGRWSEAEEELGRAVELFDATYRALRSAALVRLGDLRVRQGRLAEAEQLLAGQQQDSYAVRPWATIQWARAERRTDRRVVAAQLERAVRGHNTSVLTVPTLALLAEMELGCGEVARARVTVAPADRDHRAGPGGRAGRVRPSGGGPGLGLGRPLRSGRGTRGGDRLLRGGPAAVGGGLREAEPGRTAGHGGPALAAAEARTAAESFAWLGATSELDRATAMLHSLGGPARTGVRRPGALTAREDEVLALVAQGLSNPEIARRLFISPKTASHHVSNMLVKLGLRNRAEAAAWAAAHGRNLTR